MKMLFPLVLIFHFGCVDNQGNSLNNGTIKITDTIYTDTVIPVDSSPLFKVDSPVIRDRPKDSNNKIKAIDDIYFGIPSSDHFRYFNREISLGECNYKVTFLGYNDYILSTNSISGLYEFRLSSQSWCNDMEYLIKLFSSKYGHPESIVRNETFGIPELTDIQEINKLDNGYIAMMEGSLPSVSNQQQSTIKYITSEKTIFPNKEIMSVYVYKWETDSISIELNEDYLYQPIGSGETFNYKGPKTGGVFQCEIVSNFVLRKKVFIDFIHRTTEIELKKHRDSKKESEESNRFNNDKGKL